MLTSLLYAQVAHITGDSDATLERLGISEKNRSPQNLLPEDDSVPVLVCPCCGGTVVLAWNRHDPLPEYAECRRCDGAIPYSDTEIYEMDLLELAAAPAPLD